MTSARERPAVVELAIADEPSAWERIGFACEGDSAQVGGVTLRFLGRDAGRGLAGWTLRGARSPDLDGLPTTVVDHPPPPPVSASEHPNGSLAVDHVVVFSPAFDRTLAAFQEAGLPLGRVAEIGVKYAPVRRGFFRLGEVLLELVDQPGDEVHPSGPPFFWGLAVTVADIDGVAAELGEQASPVRDAVQPGRRIVPLRREAGLALPLALMSPDPARQQHSG